MKIIKRNGSEADFDLAKIVAAVTKANAACEREELTGSQINDIAEFVEFKIKKANRALSVEEIQDIVEDQIMAQGAFEVAIVPKPNVIVEDFHLYLYACIVFMDDSII